MVRGKQKVSGCFRSAEYAYANCQLSSNPQVIAYRGYNPRIAIQIALPGNAATIARVVTMEFPFLILKRARGKKCMSQ
ncbi:hypothetical protein A1359_06015 [Methylomonas lenta]|uniref:Uncharacterized protein n=1 Tax=Methylomonas lenta TaxID=980561 RepID=A0A177NIV3_9GAMM|nr:hypothetical protein A1359_06015 [Methylomonas lenta]